MQIYTGCTNIIVCFCVYLLSYPTWVRELKSQQCANLSGGLCRTLRGCVSQNAEEVRGKVNQKVVLYEST